MFEMKVDTRYGSFRRHEENDTFRPALRTFLTDQLGDDWSKFLDLSISDEMVSLTSGGYGRKTVWRRCKKGNVFTLTDDKVAELKAFVEARRTYHATQKLQRDLDNQRNEFLETLSLPEGFRLSVGKYLVLRKDNMTISFTNRDLLPAVVELSFTQKQNGIMRDDLITLVHTSAITEQQLITEAEKIQAQLPEWFF